MMNKEKFIILIIAVISVVSLMLHFVEIRNEKKIAFVKSPDLIYGYKGTKEVQSKFNTKVKLFETQLDTLKQDYQSSLTLFQKEYSQMNEEDKSYREQLLRHQEQNVLKYKQDIEQKIAKEEQEMMEGVLNQINSFVQQYAEENGYFLVFGTTTQGNILYGDAGIDLTEEILTELNAQY